MKQVKVAVIGFQPLADGGAVVLTRPSSSNPSENGVFKLKAGAVARIAQRALGITGPLAVVALKQAIGSCSGKAVMSIDVFERKAGETWENKTTGETGVYGVKSDGKDWLDYRNHEIDLGAELLGRMLDRTLDRALDHMAIGAQVAPVVAVQRPAAKLGITENTEGTQETSDNADNKEETL